MSARLEIIKSLLTPARIIADVGCDHGMIAKYCSESGIAEMVIASDISERCLAKARALLNGADNVKFVNCDGIDYVCDEAVISGMGGTLIASIIGSAKCLPKTVVVSPHSDHAKLRRALISYGYGIDRDVAVIDRGKFYAVIRAIMGGGKTELTELETLFGTEYAIHSEALVTYLNKLYNTYMLAPEHNKQKLEAVCAAMAAQGVEPERDDT